MTDDTSPNYYMLGASYGGNDDQTERFVREGVWINGWPDRNLDTVNAIKPGDRVAIKAAFTRKNNLPFDADGMATSTMRIKATGVVTENLGDGRHLKVTWNLLDPPREWYLYTYQGTIWKLNMSDWRAQALVDFAFNGAEQDFELFLADPRYSQDSSIIDDHDDASEELASDTSLQSPYNNASILDDGCFLPPDELDAILLRLRSKKNLILQGPPGTGKTWLAKRLGYAICGERGCERVRSVQFHPTLSYEDFVRGWRPSGKNGELALVDGIFMEMVSAALNERGKPHVLVIEEINRGNPAQIFGELLTLIEAARRNPDDALELSYRSNTGPNNVYVPPNLYIIGTMNLADRSLAIVDFALRRRFAFNSLKPTLGRAWHTWVTTRFNMEPVVATRIEHAINELNSRIESDTRLGAQYCVGHSYVTPHERITDGGTIDWFRAVVTTEIYPLLEEYYFDAPEKAKELVAVLLQAAE